MSAKANKANIIVLFCICLLFLVFLLVPIAIGYSITIACAIVLVGLIVCILLSLNEIRSQISKNINKYSILALLLVLIFFMNFSILFMNKAQLVFFDENIYPSIALNILNHGNALTCIYGTAQLGSCYVNSLGFDPNGWPFLIAIAFRFFGTGIATSYGLELLIGILSIAAIFLLASSLADNKEIPIISAAIFALIPEVFIWSRTPANSDLAFMLFSTLTMFFLVLLTKKKTSKMLMLFLLSLAFTIYIRVEGLLIVPLAFALLIFSENGDLSKKTTAFFKKVFNPNWIVLFISFFILMIPEIVTILITKPEFNDTAAIFVGSAGAFSFSYLQINITQNISFLLGYVNKYPLIFLPEITIFAIIGITYLVFSQKQKSSSLPTIILLYLFLSFFIFYGFYFAGSVLSGPSVRFMLAIYPSLAILAAFGTFAIINWLATLFKTRQKYIKKWVYLGYAAVVLGFFAIPFIYAMPLFTHPNYSYASFPIMLNETTSANTAPYTLAFDNKSYSFIEDNYKVVPNNCLVLSEQPYLWYTLNRSSASFILNASQNANFKNYSCFVLDSTYGCAISPFNNGVCKAYETKYKLKVLTNENIGPNQNLTLYQILNYTTNKT
jgi:hypothetical protein